MMGTREKVGYKILVSKQNQQVLFLSNTRALCTGVWMSTTLSIKPTFSRFYVFVSFVKLPKTMPILQRKQYSSINSTALLKVKENQSVTKKKRGTMYQCSCCYSSETGLDKLWPRVHDVVSRAMTL